MGIRHGKTVVVAAVAMAAVLLAGSAIAVAGPGPRAKTKAKGLVLGVHADISLVRRDGSTDAFVVDRGKVTGETMTSVTLERRDGVSVTLALDAATEVRGDLEVGRAAIVFSRGGKAFAILAPRVGARARLGPGGRLIKLRHRPPARRLLGVVHADVKLIRADRSQDAFSVDRGEVTAASSTSLTIKRPDGPSITKSIAPETKVRGRLVVGGKAAVYSRGGAAFAIIATARGS